MYIYPVHLCTQSVTVCVGMCGLPHTGHVHRVSALAVTVCGSFAASGDTPPADTGTTITNTDTHYSNGSANSCADSASDPAQSSSPLIASIRFWEACTGDILYACLNPKWYTLLGKAVSVRIEMIRACSITQKLLCCCGICNILI